MSIPPPNPPFKLTPKSKLTYLQVGMSVIACIYDLDFYNNQLFARNLALQFSSRIDPYTAIYTVIMI